MFIPGTIYWLLVAIWGLALGSFTTCVLYRVPRGLSLWQSRNGSHRSFCPQCHTPLGMADLVPVFSWLLQKGKCRHCGAWIGMFYPFVELVVTLATIGLAWLMDGSHWVFVAAFILPFLAALYGLWQRFSRI